MPTAPSILSLGSDELLRLTPAGLYCPAGGFYVDPWRAVDKAVITHAHTDHCRAGSKHYLCTAPGKGVTAERVHKGASIQTLDYGEAITLGDVRLSLHPAGHILGSAQVRVEALGGEHRGQVWVISGDYRPGHEALTGNPTCVPFTPVACDVFITESTFGLPIYRWRPPGEVFGQINAWWQRNRAEGVASVIFAYALGKAQRVLSGLDRRIGPVYAHGSVRKFVDLYKEAGVDLPEVRNPQDFSKAEWRDGALVVAPQSVLGTPWLKKFGPASLASASGWMQARGGRRRAGFERGFVLSDHTDWPGLLQTIQDTGCQRVGVTHGQVDAVVRYVNEHTQVQAFPVPTRFSDTDASDDHDDDGEDDRTQDRTPESETG